MSSGDMESVHSPLHAESGSPQQRMRRYKSSSMQATLSAAKDDSLYVGVLDEVRRSRTCAQHGHYDLALKHLREAISLCDDYDGCSALWEACRILENELALAKASSNHQRPSKRRRAISVQDSRQSHPTRISPASDADPLFGLLLAETQHQYAAPSDARDSQQGSLRRSQSLSDAQSGRSNKRSMSGNPVRASALNFIGIDDFLRRLKQGLIKSKPTSRIDEALKERVAGWQAHQPRSPSSFKNSEESSPRRHSFPVASPPVSPTSVSIRDRKGSTHGTLQVIQSSPLQEPNSPIEDIASYSGSDYSRRRSQDETSTALSDTPALSKLIDHVHSNPFVESNNTIVTKIRRLSADIPALTPLTVPASPTHETSEPTVPSPLRESFVADEDTASVLSGTPRAQYEIDINEMVSSPPRNRQSNLPVAIGNSPTRSSPLRKTFSAQPTRTKRKLSVKRAFPSRLPTPIRKSLPPRGLTESSVFAHQDDYSDVDSTEEGARDAIEPSKGIALTGKCSVQSSTNSSQSETSRSVCGISKVDSPFLTGWSWKDEDTTNSKQSPLPKSETSSQSPSPLTVPGKERHGSADAPVLGLPVTPPQPIKSRLDTADSSSPQLSLSTASSHQSIRSATLQSHVSKSQALSTAGDSHISPMRFQNTISILPAPAATAPTPTPVTPPRHSPSISTSISSMTAKFEKQTPTHRQPASSSPGTKRTFAAGLAKWGGADGSPTHKPAPRARTQGQVSLADGPFGTSSTATGNTASSLSRTTSVMQRAMSINERPSWKMPGKSSPDSAAKNVPKPWQRAAANSTGSPGCEQRGRTRLQQTGLGGSREVSDNSSTGRGGTTRGASRSSSLNSGFVRFGNEMGRGAGIQRK